MIVKSSKAKRFVWILSLALGPVVYCILLLTLPGTPNIEAIGNNIVELLVTIAFYWAGGFAFVWIVYWLSKFVVKYAPFM
jgi:hypothetical protein